MAIVRVLTSTITDGPTGGGGEARLFLTLDQRPGGQEFILAAEVDGTSRFISTRYRITVVGQPDEAGEVPAGQIQRFPASGDFVGLRIDGGREYSVSLS